MSEAKPTVSDLVDVRLSVDVEASVETIKKQFHLESSQDVLRIAIAYALRLGVVPEASDLPNSKRAASWKASEMVQGGDLVAAILALHPDSEPMRRLPNRCVEHLMNEGAQLLGNAIDQGEIEVLGDLMATSPE